MLGNRHKFIYTIQWSFEAPIRSIANETPVNDLEANFRPKHLYYVNAPGAWLRNSLKLLYQRLLDDIKAVEYHTIPKIVPAPGEAVTPLALSQVEKGFFYTSILDAQWQLLQVLEQFH
jgi:hypothetical protein